MMLIFFLGAAQAVPLYKMNNEIVNDNNSILDSDLHNLAFADSDTAVVAAPQKQPPPPYMTPCPAYIDNLPETPELILYKRLDTEQQETLRVLNEADFSPEDVRTYGYSTGKIIDKALRMTRLSARIAANALGATAACLLLGGDAQSWSMATLIAILYILGLSVRACWR